MSKTPAAGLGSVSVAAGLRVPASASRAPAAGLGSVSVAAGSGVTVSASKASAAASKAATDSPSAPAPAPLLEAENLSKRFGAVEALCSVSFSINAGEVVGLVGDNGAGKSTFVNIVSGVLHPTSGHVRFDGNLLDLANPAAARDAGIETVYQGLALVEMFDIASNFYLGREVLRTGIRRPLGVLNRRLMRNRSKASIEQIAAKFPDLAAAVETMSGGQRQIVAIAKAAFWGGRLLLLDEPTAALGVQESASVLELIRGLAADSNRAMIMIAHNLQHIWSVCTRILVLRRGSLAADLQREETTPEEVVAYITGVR